MEINLPNISNSSQLSSIYQNIVRVVLLIIQTNEQLAARVKFADVVKRLEKISNSDLKLKAEIVSKFFKSIFVLQKKFHDEEGPDADASFYPFLRLFVPTKDLERGSFGIQTTTLGRLYVKALGISAKSETAQKLTNLNGNTTDYGDIVYDVMKDRSPETGEATVFEVNRYLDLIADHFQNNERNKIDTSGEEVLLKKSENFTAKYLKANDPKLIPCFCIYDLIFYNGTSLINKPYAERTRLLSTLINQQKGALMLSERVKLRDGNHFLECLNKAFDSNMEGIVIKQEDSKYHPGQREKGGWFKMKPDYENNLISDFDLLIIGGFYNDNRTAIDSFLLAVSNKDDTTNDPDVFYAVCKIRNGFSRKQFREIINRLQPYQHKVNVTKNHRSSVHECPAGIEWANANPDFWYEPKHSIVLQIKASELVKTTRYRTNYSFRFPRVMEIRWDKSWYDTCSLKEFDTFCLTNSTVEKLTKRQATAADLVTLRKRSRKGPASNTLPSTSKASIEVQTLNSVFKMVKRKLIPLKIWKIW